MKIRRIVMAVVIGLCAVVVVFLIAHGTKSSGSIVSGRIILTSIPVGPDNSLSIGAPNIIPGDKITREGTFRNTGSSTVGSITLYITSSDSSILASGGPMGLQTSVQTCSSAWISTSLAEGGYSYQCLGHDRTVAVTRPLGEYKDGVLLTPIAAIVPGRSISVAVTMLVPDLSNQYQGIHWPTLNYSITGTQRVG